MTSSNQRLGVSIALAGAVLLSFDTLLLRGIGGQYLTVAFWRGLLMGLTAVLVLLIPRRRPHHSLAPIRSVSGVVVAAFYGLASIFFVLAVTFTSVANMLVIIATAPFWAALASQVFLRETIAQRTWIAIGCAMTGVGLVVLPGIGANNFIGDGFAMLTALCMAAAFTISRRVKEPLGLAPSFGGGLSAILLLPFVPAFNFETNGQIVLMTLEGAILMPIALGLLALAPRYLPAPQVGLFLLLETALGPLWVLMVIGEMPTLHTVLGGIIVISALAIHTVSSIRVDTAKTRNPSAQGMDRNTNQVKSATILKVQK